MLYRNRKPDDPNEGKWLGIGGKIKDGESLQMTATKERCSKKRASSSNRGHFTE